MGYQRDQRLPSEREEEAPPPAYAPSLPHRESISELRINANHEYSDDSDDEPAVPRLEKSRFTWSTHDPRNASTESLVPSASSDGRKKLLLIYIHGFMGNETSFQSFPAHVHGLVTELMAASHVVHTKIYPRYKSRRAIEFARDEFSQWLRPHEGPDTDVLLLGHSMGGILSAEVVLKQAEPPQDSPMQHRILGTINFDVPFLGMHPGVVYSGIGSLFRPGEKSPAQSPRGDEVMMPMPSADYNNTQFSSSTTTLGQSSAKSGSLDLVNPSRDSRSQSPFSIPVDDPNYNPAYENDVVRPVRKGWENALHFMTKHSGGLRQAAKAYVTSHVEFGGTMADYPKLNARYKKVRALEDVRPGTQSRTSPPRVRFVNFYTASTGILSKPKAKSPALEYRGRQLGDKDDQETGSTNLLNPASTSTTRTTSPRISVESSEDVQQSIETDSIQKDHTDLKSLDPIAQPVAEAPRSSIQTDQSLQEQHVEPKAEDESLPPLPSLPSKLEPFDPSLYKNEDVLKVARKDYARKEKAYASAVKDHAKAVADRKKLQDKRVKKEAKEKEKAEKEKKKIEAREEKEKQKQKEREKEKPAAGDTSSTALAPVTSPETSANNTGPAKPAKPARKKRDRKFCITPSKTNGVRDPCWVRVFMEGVDEVGAHCGLFFEDKGHYEALVCDVGELIREWVVEDGRRRT